MAGICRAMFKIRIPRTITLSVGRYSHSARETGTEILRQHTEFTQWIADQVFRKNKWRGLHKNTVKVRKLNTHAMQLTGSKKTKTNFAFLQFSFQRTMKVQISLKSPEYISKTATLFVNIYLLVGMLLYSYDS